MSVQATHENDVEVTSTPEEILADAASDIALLTSAPTIEAKVEAAAVLWQIQHLAKKAVENLKAELRAEAQRRFDADGEREQELRSGDSAWASIRFPTDSVVIRKGEDIEGARREIGSSFDGYFDRTVTYKPCADFPEKILAESNEALRDRLLALTDRQPNTPRISLRRKGQSG